MSVFERWGELVGRTPWGPADDVDVRYLEHQPGRSRTVQLRAMVGGAPVLAAVVTTVDDVGRSDVVLWYPDDPALPGLAAGWAAVAAVLDLPTPAPSPMAWVPGRRLVVGTGDRVVKFHADPAETDFAVRTARRAGEVVPVPAVVHVDLDRALHVQERIEGTTLGGGDAGASSGAAMHLLRALHGADADGLPVVGPGHLLAACAPVAGLVRWYRPDWSDRVDAVVEALHERAPTDLDLRPSHGDFNVGQLLRRRDGSLAVVDVDTLCMAPPALDLASYAANLVSGRDGDLDRASEVVASCVEAYGEVPEGLDWYLPAMVLRRLDRSIRRHKRRWPERTERSLVAVERLVGG